MLQQKCEPIKRGSARQILEMRKHHKAIQSRRGIIRVYITDQTGEFDPGSERTLAAGLTHASRA